MNKLKITILEIAYSQLTKMKNNREPLDAHIKSMKDSVNQFGILRLPVVAKNPKGKNYFVIDGQHLVKSLKGKDKVTCIVYEAKNESEIIKAMIALNNTAKKWNLMNYIDSFADANKQYKTLKDKIESEKVQETVIIMAYTQQKVRGLATKLVKTGDFKIENKIYSENLISNLYDLNKFTHNTRAHNQALMVLMLEEGKNYNHVQFKNNMLNSIKLIQLIKAETKESEILSLLKDVYRGKVKIKLAA